MPATQETTEPNASPPGFIDRLAAVSEKLDKIWSFAAKVASGIFIVVTPLYTWAGNQIAVVPRPWLFVAEASLSIVGVWVWTFTYRRRDQWGRWRTVLTAVGGGISLAIAVAVWLLMPSPPVWQRLDVPQTLNNPRASADLPLTVLRDQLLGSGGSLPGDEFYKQMLATRRGDASLQQQWAGYYAPVIVASTTPASVSLRTGTMLATQASIGAIVIIWSPGPNQIPSVRVEHFGFDALRDAVSLPVSIAADERAAIFVFVFPLTSEASAHLPQTFDEAISVQ